MVQISRITQLPEMEPLIEEAEAHGLAFLRPLTEDFRRGTTTFDRPGEVLLMAIDDGTAVGVGAIHIDPYTNNPKVGRMLRVFVSPRMQGRGVGGRLIKQLLEHAKGHFDELRTQTGCPIASRFYELAGFQRVANDSETTHRMLLAGTEK